MLIAHNFRSKFDYAFTKPLTLKYFRGKFGTHSLQLSKPVMRFITSQSLYNSLKLYLTYFQISDFIFLIGSL